MGTRIISRKGRIQEEWKRIEKVERKGVWYDILITKDIKELHVSNHGRIKKIRTTGVVTITSGSDTHGYRELSITYDKDGKRKSSKFAIHRLVAYAFLDKHEWADRPNHINGCKHHNWVWNLEWTNAKGNTKHAMDNGLFRISKGQERSNCKLDNVSFQIIVDMLLTNYTDTEIYNVLKTNGCDYSTSSIWSIRYKRKWKHLTKDYKFPSNPRR